MRAALLLIFLAGCSSIEKVATEVLPTARYCHEVHYDRLYDAVEVSAKCTAPFGGM